MLSLEDFNYYLPEELIATQPPKVRGASRLLIVDAATNTTTPNLLDKQFTQLIDFLSPGDLMIFNDSKVLKARLHGHKISGGQIELLIERILPDGKVTAHIKSNKTIKLGLQIILAGNLCLQVTDELDGLFQLVPDVANFDWLTYLDQFGEVPLPPYMKRSASISDITRYQTI